MLLPRLPRSRPGDAGIDHSPTQEKQMERDEFQVAGHRTQNGLKQAGQGVAVGGGRIPDPCQEGLGNVHQETMKALFELNTRLCAVADRLGGSISECDKPSAPLSAALLDEARRIRQLTMEAHCTVSRIENCI
jgi:hypothetical protein